MNPFLDSLSPPVHIDCESAQRIHYAAMQAAASGMYSHSLPASIPLAILKERAQLDGTDIYFLHPAEIERLFANVTLATFRAVRSLYCSRLGRSIRMVWQILQVMANEAGVPPLSYEVIWALCLYLKKQRQESIGVPIARGQDAWWIGQTSLSLFIEERATSLYHPVILWCVEISSSHVLSFRIVPRNEVNIQAPLVLYDALVASRLPQARVATGLLWHLPKQIVSTLSFSQPCLAACQRVGLRIKKERTEEPLVIQTLRETWEPELTGKRLPLRACEKLLDTYLYRFHGHGPLREFKQRANASVSLIGYNQDPAWQFPLLRCLLPEHVGTITTEGKVLYDGLHYAHELLSYWPGSSVTLRRSTHAEATAWIYLDQEFLCQAQAEELRRRDGTYRPFR